MRLRKHDVVAVVLLAGAALYVGLIETRYYLDLYTVASTKLTTMPNTIGEYWAQGKMPVQYSDYAIINLGHTSYNPFDYERPSIRLWRDRYHMPTEISFSTRDTLPEEAAIVESFNNGDFTGLKWYLLILGAAISYVAARCPTSIRKKSKQPSA